MGAVITNKASAEDIIKDVRKALVDGEAKKGQIWVIVEAELGPMGILIDTVEQELADARKVAAPFIAALKAANEVADDDLARLYDDLWNDLGRPAHDRGLALVFPGGIGHYADGDTTGQPDRMELLAQLLERGLLAKLTKAQCDAAAKRVRASALPLQAALDDARMPMAKLAQFERIYTAVGHAAQFELASLKRSLKNAGLTETQIHDIIPDRSPPPKKAVTPAAAPAAPAAPAATAP